MDTVAVLRKAARERAGRTSVARRHRREKAWEIARAAAALLKSRYRVSRVVAFGSLTDVDRFHPWSDIDLAVWRLAPGDYYEAVARVLDVGGEVKVDLIRAERCKPYLRAAIEGGSSSERTEFHISPQLTHLPHPLRRSHRDPGRVRVNALEQAGQHVL